jgi:putative glutamine amidotransferase
MGGDLYQHLPEKPGGAIEHRKRKADDPDTAHDVQVESDSVLAGALEHDGVTHVNSFHHQAAHELGRGVKPVAWAPDGVVEGIELPDQPFAVGVQWHAEALVDRPDQAALFEAFVEAARRYDTAPPARVRRAA